MILKIVFLQSLSIAEIPGLIELGVHFIKRVSLEQISFLHRHLLVEQLRPV